MEKLGGISFGAPPGAFPGLGSGRQRSLLSPGVQEAVTDAGPAPEADIVHDGKPAPEEVEAEDEEETADAARARRAAIAARLAAGGGMRLGMLPGAAPPAPSVPPQAAETNNGDDAEEMKGAGTGADEPAGAPELPTASEHSQGAPPPLPPGRHSRISATPGSRPPVPQGSAPQRRLPYS